MGVNELEGINLYELLGLTINATLSDVCIYNLMSIIFGLF